MTEVAASASDGPESAWAIHGQVTYTEQETDAFAAPYRGHNSLSPSQGKETTDATLYVGRRLWRGAELWVNPEIDQGFGLDNTVGLAGFPSGEAYKVGRNRPYFRLQRAFVRDTIDAGGDTISTDAGANVFKADHTTNRWVVTAGKFSVGDVFDVNQYAHDPRGDFLNWSVIDGGAFDYAADAWGYTAGVAIERYAGHWTIRGAAFDMSTVPNSEHLQPGLHQFQWIGEIERRYSWAGAPGKTLVTVFDSRARMALLDDALARAALEGGPIELPPVRRYRSRVGVSLNAEQALTDDVGLFARASSAGGNVETYEFTDIDRSILLGAAIKGVRWSRPNDTWGFAWVSNQISDTRRRYLAAGGLGILVGDGRLENAGPEQIAETYYRIQVASFLHLSLDYQRVRNPAYNADRGPASVYAVRVHLQF